jgi:hypothetical protein
MSNEHPRGRRSGKLPVSYRRAKNPATPGSFEGLENREEVIAKPLIYSPHDIVGGNS